MLRAHRALSLFRGVAVPFLAVPFFAVLLGSSSALAQTPGQPPPLPMAVDLKKVPVGAWAEYDMTVGKLPPMKSRMALVAKSGDTNTLEMIMQGGMLSMAGGKLTMQTLVEADQAKEKPVKRVLMQIGDNDPMEMPIDSKQQTQFHKPNPKSFVKDETVKVAAGTFKTKHYRDKTPGGDPFDFWVSPEVPPFGIVKVEAEQKHGAPQAQGPVKFELTRSRQGREDDGDQAGQAVRSGADGGPADGRRQGERGPGPRRSVEGRRGARKVSPRGGANRRWRARPNRRLTIRRRAGSPRHAAWATSRRARCSARRSRKRPPSRSWSRSVPRSSPSCAPTSPALWRRPRAAATPARRGRGLSTWGHA